MIYKVKVLRHQKWEFTIRANSEEEARNMADELTGTHPADDDYAYSTEATLAKNQTGQADNE
jgi:hypothetical protein